MLVISVSTMLTIVVVFVLLVFCFIFGDILFFQAFFTDIVGQSPLSFLIFLFVMLVFAYLITIGLNPTLEGLILFQM